MSMYGKKHYNIVISLQLIKINEKNEDNVVNQLYFNKKLKKEILKF